jgi:hypothetical protein
MNKSALRTVRFIPTEAKKIDVYLKKNPVFDSFSSLARAATLNFISQRVQIQFNPIQKDCAKRPSFLWDHDLSEEEIWALLRQKGMSNEKSWLIARILTEATFNEVFEYLTVDDIDKALPFLRMPQKTMERWHYAIQRWKSHD